MERCLFHLPPCASALRISRIVVASAESFAFRATPAPQAMSAPQSAPRAKSAPQVWKPVHNARGFRFAHFSRLGAAVPPTIFAAHLPENGAVLHFSRHTCGALALHLARRTARRWVRRAFFVSLEARLGLLGTSTIGRGKENQDNFRRPHPIASQRLSSLGLWGGTLSSFAAFRARYPRLSRDSRVHQSRFSHASSERGLCRTAVAARCRPGFAQLAHPQPAGSRPSVGDLSELQSHSSFRSLARPCERCDDRALKLLHRASRPGMEA